MTDILPQKAPTARSAAKRQAIVQAARGLFLDQGYAASSTDALAAAAGVSKQTLYSYFPGKAELLAEVVAQALSRLMPAGTPPEAQSLPELRAQLLAFAAGLTHSLLSPDGLALLRLLTGEAAQRPELRAVVRQSVPERLLMRVGGSLAAAHARGLIHAPDINLSARLLVGPLMSFVVLDGLLGSELPQPPDAKTLAYITDAFLRSVEVNSVEVEHG